MSRLDITTQVNLLQEARTYLRDIQPIDEVQIEAKAEPVVLTEEHIIEWLEVFYDDRIKMDTCNEARVKR